MPPRGPFISDMRVSACGTSQPRRRGTKRTRHSVRPRNSVACGWRDLKSTCITDLHRLRDHRNVAPGTISKGSFSRMSILEKFERVTRLRSQTSRFCSSQALDLLDEFSLARMLCCRRRWLSKHFAFSESRLNKTLLFRMTQRDHYRLCSNFLEGLSMKLYFSSKIPGSCARSVAASNVCVRRCGTCSSVMQSAANPKRWR